MSGSQALDRADQLMSMKGGMMRLDTVWGVGGARRPVRSLVKQMTLLLKEFLSSGDTEEVIRSGGSRRSSGQWFGRRLEGRSDFHALFPLSPCCMHSSRS